MEQPSLTIKEHRSFHVKLQCRHPVGQRGGALFFVRAYGRSLLPGSVVDHEDGTYTVSIVPHDTGPLTLEVVLTLSQRPDYEKLPLPRDMGEPSYEGYMVPGFPLTVTVVDDDPPKKKAPATILCPSSHLYETSTDSALQTGRWLVTNKTRSFPYTDITKIESYLTHQNFTIDNYRNSIHSTGIQMDYFYNDCDVLSHNDMTTKEVWKEKMASLKQTGQLHVLYVGDSNTRNQYNYFRDHIAKPLKFVGGKMKLSYVDMMGYWPETFNKTRDQIQDIIARAHETNENIYVVFNAGLHEVTNRCMIEGGKRKGRVFEGLCHEVYQKDVRELTDLMQTIPASLRIWQTSMAGWPKWGVFGIEWPLDKGQLFPREPNFCSYLNDLAWNIMQEKKMAVMDTFWLTLSRADHREVSQNIKLRTSYKLVHLGVRRVRIIVYMFRFQ